jgi:hypothetical protein
MSLIMLPAVKRAPAWAAVAATLALGACGGEASAPGAAPTVEGIANAIEELEGALDDRDLDRVCERVFSPEARRRAGGEECRARLMRTTRNLDDPRIELVSIRLGRGSATARVRAWTADEAPAIDSIELVPSGTGYRVESLSAR